MYFSKHTGTDLRVETGPGANDKRHKETRQVGGTSDLNGLVKH